MCSRSNLHLAQCWWLRRRVKYWRLFQLERLHTPGGSWVTHRLRAKTRKQKTAARRRNGARARTRAQGAVYVPNGALARSLATAATKMVSWPLLAAPHRTLPARGTRCRAGVGLTTSHDHAVTSTRSTLNGTRQGVSAGYVLGGAFLPSFLPSLGRSVAMRLVWERSVPGIVPSSARASRAKAPRRPLLNAGDNSPH